MGWHSINVLTVFVEIKKDYIQKSISDGARYISHLPRSFRTSSVSMRMRINSLADSLR